jgi:hypothetical protein
MLFFPLWIYRSSVKITSRFTSFHLTYDIEVVMLIKCRIPSLLLVFEVLSGTSTPKRHLVELEKLDEDSYDALTSLEDSHK